MWLEGWIRVVSWAVHSILNVWLLLYVWQYLQGVKSHATNSFILVFVGASVLAAQSANRAIVALEGDKELYDELLHPLQVAASNSHGVHPTHFVDLDDDDDDTLPQQGAVSLCE